MVISPSPQLSTRFYKYQRVTKGFFANASIWGIGTPIQFPSFFSDAGFHLE